MSKKKEKPTVHNGQICANCGGKVKLMVMKNTGFCCANCQKGRPKK